MDAVSTADVVDVEKRMEEIKSTGYWRVNIRPTKFEKSRIDTLSHCWELVESCRVYLRGWDYPAVSVKEKVLGDEWVQSGADFRGIVELWRFYQSGQFIHYFSCLEDRHRPEEVSARLDQNVFRGLSVVSTLYRVTEIFEFAARLAQEGILQPQVQISIKLEGMKNRQLFFWEPYRYLSESYICRINEIPFDKELPATDIIAARHEEALKAAIHIFERFGWQDPPWQILAEDQRKLLERRL
jgi:hypothetical protein